MDSILSDLKLSCVLVYLDNINVFSRTFLDHLNHLEEVFKRLCHSGLKLKARKCQFFKDNLEFLGFNISRSGIFPVPAKIDAVEKMRTLENMCDI